VCDDRRVFRVVMLRCQEAEQAQLLEELCELIIVLKKDSSPQTIECLLMCCPLSSRIGLLLQFDLIYSINILCRYIAYAGLQFDVKRTPYGRYVVLLYATTKW